MALLPIANNYNHLTCTCEHPEHLKAWKQTPVPSDCWFSDWFIIVSNQVVCC